MTYGPVQSKVNWYRSPIDRANLAELNQRSDLLGLMQALGHLGLVALTRIIFDPPPFRTL